MVDLNFRPLFSSPFAFANFGEAAKSLNKRLVKDIDVEIADYQGVTEERSFALNTCGWQSKSGLENSHSSFKELSVAISKCLFPMLSQSGIEDEYASKLKATGCGQMSFLPLVDSLNHIFMGQVKLYGRVSIIRPDQKKT